MNCRGTWNKSEQVTCKWLKETSLIVAWHATRSCRQTWSHPALSPSIGSSLRPSYFNYILRSGKKRPPPSGSAFCENFRQVVVLRVILPFSRVLHRHTSKVPVKSCLLQNSCLPFSSQDMPSWKNRVKINTNQIMIDYLAGNYGRKP